MLLRQSVTPQLGLDPTAVRWTESELAKAQESTQANPVPGFYYTPYASLQQRLEYLAETSMKRRAVEFYLKEQGVAAVLIPSSHSHGLLNTGSTSPLMRPSDPESLPQIVIAAEHASRLHRLIERGVPPQLEVESKTTYVYRPEFNVNVVGDISGTDKAGEFVLIGAHLDSEAAGSGAIDNGTGSAVMLEVMRILRAVEIRPRRSVRIVLWTGEEQGYIGSLDYVRKNVGDPVSGLLVDAPQRIAAYMNLDHGTGQIRGIYLQGNSNWRTLFTRVFEPMAFLGVSTVTLESTRGTDHMVFDALNVPAFQFVQDLIDLDSVTGHTDMDSLDHAIKKDLQINAAVIAATVAHIANLEEIPDRRAEVPDYGLSIVDE